MTGEEKNMAENLHVFFLGTTAVCRGEGEFPTEL